MSSQGARSTKLTESAMVLVSWRDMQARLVAVSKRKHHRVGGAPQPVTVPKTVRRSRSTNVTTLPTGNGCPGKRVSVGCSGIVVEERAARRPLTRFAWCAELLAPGATGGQCAEVVVGQYSTLRR